MLVKAVRRTAFTVLLLACPNAFPQSVNAVNVLTQHNDNGRTGLNPRETILTPESVNSPSFGYLFSRPVDDKIYGQPLYVSGVQIPGKGQHSVVLVATASDSVYLFDADNPNASFPLWQTSLLGLHETPGSASDVGQSHRFTNFLLQPRCGTDVQPYQDMIGNIGVTGTPVIDLATHTVYAVAKSKTSARLGLFTFSTYYQRLHALDLGTGHERPGWPVEIKASIRGSNAGAPEVINFNPRTQNQRAALVLWNPPDSSRTVVFISYASHGDAPPYHGWLLGYDAASGQSAGSFITTHNIVELQECGYHEGGGSIWQGGQGPAVDGEGNIYFMTGNGSFDPAAGNYGSSFVKLGYDPARGILYVKDYFAPQRWETINYWDADIGSAGASLLPNTSLLIGAGKEGWMYVLDKDSLGGLESRDRSVGFRANGYHFGVMHVHGSPVTFDSGEDGQLTYVWPENDFLRAFRVDHAGAYAKSPEVAHSAIDTGCSALSYECMPGGLLSISANGMSGQSAIVWAAVPDKEDAVHKDVPGRLIAFRASPVKGKLEILWRSDLSPGYAAASHQISVEAGYRFAKFGAPTVANGHVYLATFSNELRVYGLH